MKSLSKLLYLTRKFTDRKSRWLLFSEWLIDSPVFTGRYNLEKKMEAQNG